MDDRSAPVYETQEASLSYAMNASINRNQSIAFGVRGLYHKQTVDISSLHENSKFLTDRGFDTQDFQSGEVNKDLMTFSTGIHWQKVDDDGVRVGYLSGSLLDFLPQGNADDGKYYSSFAGTTSFRAVKNGNMSIFPEALYIKSNHKDFASVGLVTRCDVKLSALQNPYYVNVITRYTTNKSGILGLQYHNEVFSLGASYEVPLSQDNMANIGAFEIGLEIRRLVKPEFKSKTLRKKLDGLNKTMTQKPKSATTSSQSSDPGAVDVAPVRKQPKTLFERLITKRDSVISIKTRTSKPIVIDHQILKINFGFNSVRMDTATTRYLDELAKVLLSDNRLKIRLTGHTDNIGTPSGNYQLSLHRANTVKAYLVNRGVNSSNIKAEGKGMAQPLNENKNEQQRARNRRVELLIYFQD